MRPSARSDLTLLVAIIVVCITYARFRAHGGSPDTSVRIPSSTDAIERAVVAVAHVHTGEWSKPQPETAKQELPRPPPVRQEPPQPPPAKQEPPPVEKKNGTEAVCGFPDFTREDLKGKKKIYMIAAGRRDVLLIHLRYVKYLVKHGVVDEVHLWMYHPPHLRADREWVQKTFERENWASDWNVKLFYPAPRFVNRYFEYLDHYINTHHEENAIVVKADDDIVFLDVNHFECFLLRSQSSLGGRDAMEYYANGINNPHSMHYMQSRRRLFPVAEFGPFEKTLSADGGGRLWRDGEFLTHRVHEYFLDNFDKVMHDLLGHNEEDSVARDLPEERVVGSHGMVIRMPMEVRFSINFMVLNTNSKLRDAMIKTFAHNTDEEMAMRTNALNLQLHPRLDYGFLTAHFTYSKQREIYAGGQNERFQRILERYARLADDLKMPTVCSGC